MKANFTFFLSFFLFYLNAQNTSDSEFFKNFYNEKLAPFYHGVASGDPLETKVIIWTRYTPNYEIIGLDNLQNHQAEVEWKVSGNSNMNSIVRQGTQTANYQNDFTVKIDVDGLKPNRTYYYQFTHQGQKSTIGRTNTLPKANQRVEQLRFALVSCSSFFSGYFNAYARIGERKDLDAVIHVGDYIYDYPDSDERVRIPENVYVDKPENLKQWRERYSLYRLDEDLQLAHQQHPWFIVWDNHDLDQDNQPCLDDLCSNKTNSIKAFYEWLPIRLKDESKPQEIYRSFKYGDLVDLLMIDGLMFADPKPKSIFDNAVDDPNRTKLGSSQFNWLKNELEQSSTHWRVLANQKTWGQWKWLGLPDYLQAEMPFPDSGFSFANNYSWDDYRAERDNIFRVLRENHHDNNIFLSGDMHMQYMMDLIENPWDPLRYNPIYKEKSVGVEVQGTSVSRGNLDEQLKVVNYRVLAEALNLGFSTFNYITNPHFVYSNSIDHGYNLIDITKKRMVAELWLSEILKKSDEEFFELGYVNYSKTNHWDLIPNLKPTKPEKSYSSLAPKFAFGKANLENNYNYETKINFDNSTPILLFPNPLKVGENVLFKFTNSDTISNFSYSIYNYHGSKVFEEKIVSLDSSYGGILETKNLQKGYYFVLFLFNGKQTVCRLMIH